MNKLEIFQEVYGKDYVFTETELSRLLRIAELIVRECMDICEDFGDKGIDGHYCADAIRKKFGVDL